MQLVFWFFSIDGKFSRKGFQLYKAHLEHTEERDIRTYYMNLKFTRI